MAVGVVAGALAIASYVELTQDTGSIARSLGHSALFRHDSAFGLLMGMATAAAYALILLLFGRSFRRRLAGAVLALAAGLSRWLLLMISIRDYHPERHYPMATFYASLLIPATFATLAWGVARRHGSPWLWTVPIAPVLIGLEVWLWLHSAWYRDFQGSHGMSLIYVLYLGPIVIACVAGWLLEARNSGSTAAPNEAQDPVSTPA